MKPPESLFSFVAHTASVPAWIFVTVTAPVIENCLLSVGCAHLYVLPIGIVDVSANLAISAPADAEAISTVKLPVPTVIHPEVV